MQTQVMKTPRTPWDRRLATLSKALGEEELAPTFDLTYDLDPLPEDDHEGHLIGHERQRGSLSYKAAQGIDVRAALARLEDHMVQHDGYIAEMGLVRNSRRIRQKGKDFVPAEADKRAGVRATKPKAPPKYKIIPRRFRPPQFRAGQK